MRWAVEKILAQTKMTYDNSRVIVVISKSSFFLRNKERERRRISRGYCRDGRPRIVY